MVSRSTCTITMRSRATSASSPRTHIEFRPPRCARSLGIFQKEGNMVWSVQSERNSGQIPQTRLGMTRPVELARLAALAPLGFFRHEKEGMYRYAEGTNFSREGWFRANQGFSGLKIVSPRSEPFQRNQGFSTLKMVSRRSEPFQRNQGFSALK